jgi:hypothetical protein
MNAIQAAAKKLVTAHGTYRAAAIASGLDLAYLYRLAKGHKSNPGEDVLRRLGLVRAYKRGKKS